MRYIRGNKGSYTPSNVCFIDTETRGDQSSNNDKEHNHKLWLGWAISGHWNGDKLHRRRETEFRNTQTVKKLLESLLDPKKPLWVFSHNAGFDATICGLWSLADKGIINIEYAVTESPPTIICFKWDGCKVYWVDSLNWFNESLEKIGNSVGLPKLIMPSEDSPEHELSVYCKRDVQILERAILMLFRFHKQHDLGCFKSTVSSQAMQCWRHRFMTKKTVVFKHQKEDGSIASTVDRVSKVTPHDNPYVKILERESYQQGYSWCNFIGKVLPFEKYYVQQDDKKGRREGPYEMGPVYVFDVNSLYPFCMSQCEWPIELIGTMFNPSVDTLADILKHHPVIANVLVETWNSPLPVKTEDGTNWCLGKFWTTLTPHELQIALISGKVKQVSFMAYYDSADIFSEYVKYFYALKTQYRQAGNHTFDKLCKMMLNALLGKFAQRTGRWLNIPNKAPRVRWGTYSEWCDETNRPETFRGLGDLLQMEQDKEDLDHTFLAIPSCVIGMARIQMVGYMALAGFENCYYCNVDSIHCNEKGRNRLYAAEIVSDHELGFLRFDGIYNEAHYRNIRDYTLDGKHKIAGIPSKALEKEPLTFAFPEFEKLDQILNRNPSNSVIITDATKKLESQFKLGSIQTDGWVTPRILKLGETMPITDRLKTDD